MICRIGLFSFDAHTITGLEETLSTPFAKIDRVENHPLYLPVGKSEEDITVSGTEIKASVKALEWLKLQIKLKRAVRFTTPTYSIKVIVEEINTSKSTFFRGVYVMQDFEIRMKRYYDESDTLLADAIGALL